MPTADDVPPNPWARHMPPPQPPKEPLSLKERQAAKKAWMDALRNSPPDPKPAVSEPPPADPQPDNVEDLKKARAKRKPKGRAEADSNAKPKPKIMVLRNHIIPLEVYRGDYFYLSIGTQQIEMIRADNRGPAALTHLATEKAFWEHWYYGTSKDGEVD